MKDTNSSTLPLQWREIVKETANIIKKGGVVLYPTDTIWGIGCDATNEEAVRRIYEIKKREDGKALLLLIDHDAKLPGIVGNVPSMAYQLIDMAIRPLTIIYPSAKNIASNLLPKEGTIGIRITKEPFSNALCKAIKVPLVSTSANISGEASPTSFKDISPEIKEAVDYIVPIRQEEKNRCQASEIISIGKNNEIKVIRGIRSEE